MVNKFTQILGKIIAIIVISIVVYVLGIFFFPEFTDKYGFSELNGKIRDFKDKSLQISSSTGSISLPF